MTLEVTSLRVLHITALIYRFSEREAHEVVVLSVAPSGAGVLLERNPSPSQMPSAFLVDAKCFSWRGASKTPGGMEGADAGVIPAWLEAWSQMQSAFLCSKD